VGGNGVTYRFAVIDSSTEVWDPPPSRPSLAPAWVGASLSAAMILALVAAGGLFAYAWTDKRYTETGDSCSRLDITPVAARLGVPAPRPQPSRGEGCSYPVESEDGLWSGYGSVRLDYGPNAAAAWLAWRYREMEGDPRDVPDLGRAARLTSQRSESDGQPVCSVYLEVLDSNLRLDTGVGAYADMPSRPCDDLDALAAAVIDSARASLARLAESP
jgi:hypothetical protein